MPRATRRGFTLIELMVVVVIVGVLSTIAVVGYRKLVLSSKSTEAQQILQSIRLAEQSYFAMTGSYYEVSTRWCPGNNPAASGSKRPWDGDCPSGATNQWKRLTVKTDGPVGFAYKAYAGPSVALPTETMAMAATRISGDAFPVSPTFNSHAMTWAAATTGPWFIVVAQGDPNNSGGIQAKALGHSQSNVVELEETY